MDPLSTTGVGLSEAEQQDVEQRKPPRAQVLYETIRREGEHELRRPATALAWSGLAAGLSMGFSLVAMGLTTSTLPHAHWTKLVVSFGYSVGFVIVIVARQQLFTENTLTPVIPLLHNRDLHTLVRVLRLWTIVLISNLLGTMAFAVVLRHGPAFSDDVKRAFTNFGIAVMATSFGTHFLRAIFSGWLIALMVWMLAGATARAFIVLMVTWGSPIFRMSSPGQPKPSMRSSTALARCAATLPGFCSRLGSVTLSVGARSLRY